MPPISVLVPAEHGQAIVAEVQRPPGFDGKPGVTVRVWLGPALELVLTLETADRLADALVDALALDDDGRPPVLYPPMVQGAAGIMGGW